MCTSSQGLHANEGGKNRGNVLPVLVRHLKMDDNGVLLAFARVLKEDFIFNALGGVDKLILRRVKDVSHRIRDDGAAAFEPEKRVRNFGLSQGVVYVSAPLPVLRLDQGFADKKIGGVKLFKGNQLHRRTPFLSFYPIIPQKNGFFNPKAQK